MANYKDQNPSKGSFLGSIKSKVDQLGISQQFIQIYKIKGGCLNHPPFYMS